MSIEWNKVTWYSKFVAVVLFVATFYIAFTLGAQYQAVLDQSLILPPLSVHTAQPAISDTLATTTQSSATTSPRACTTDVDCPAHFSCVVTGPLIAGPVPKKICIPPGQAMSL